MTIRDTRRGVRRELLSRLNSGTETFKCDFCPGAQWEHVCRMTVLGVGLVTRSLHSGKFRFVRVYGDDARSKGILRNGDVI